MSERGWTMNPEEELPLSVDLSNHIDPGVTISSPSVRVYTKSDDDVYTDVTTSLGFVITKVVVNTSDILREDKGTTLAGKGVSFQLKASATQGTYFVVVSAVGSDATAPKTERRLVVGGGL